MSKAYAQYAISNVEDGVGISKIEEQYYASTSNTSLSGGSWGSSATWTKDKPYIWTRSKITWDDGREPTYTTPVVSAYNGIYEASKEDINNVQVGGRNYIMHSETFEGWTFSSAIKVTKSDGVINISNSGSTSNAYIYATAHLYGDNDDWTNNKSNTIISFYVKSSDWESVVTASGDTGLKALICNISQRNASNGRMKYIDLKPAGNSLKYATINGEKIEFLNDCIPMYNGKVANDMWIRLRLKDFILNEENLPYGSKTEEIDHYAFTFYLAMNGSVSFKRPKLEKGTTMTDWTPAPEDTSTAILENATTISNVKNVTDAIENTIFQGVSQTNYSSRLTTMMNDIDNANTGANKWLVQIYSKDKYSTAAEKALYTIDAIKGQPTQTLLINDSSLALGTTYGTNYIGYGLTFIYVSSAINITHKWTHTGAATFYVDGAVVASASGNGSSVNYTLKIDKIGWHCLEIVWNAGTGNSGFSFTNAFTTLTSITKMNCYYATVTGRQQTIENKTASLEIDVDSIKADVERSVYYTDESGNKRLLDVKSYVDQSADRITSTVTELSSDVNDLATIDYPGRNLYVIKTDHEGYLTTNGAYGTYGTPNATYKERTSDDIIVKPGENIQIQIWVTLPGTNTFWAAFQYYSDSKALVGSRAAVTSGTKLADGRTYYRWNRTVPEGATILRVSARMYNDGVIKVERGTNVTDYSLAPEDEDKPLVAAVNERVSSMIEQTAGEIRLEVSNVANGLQKTIYHTCSSSAGTAGYFKFATCVITTSYANQAITFSIHNRGRQVSDVSLTFKNSPDSDPEVETFCVTGTARLFIHKTATSTWDLYVAKTESYDNAAFTNFSSGSFSHKIAWTWSDATVTELPEGYIAAYRTSGSFSESYYTTEAAAITIAKNQIKSIVINGTNGATATQSADGFTWTVDTSSIKSIADTAKTTAENIQIGGINLLKNSAPKTTSYWLQAVNWRSTLVDCNSAFYGKAIRATCTASTGSGGISLVSGSYDINKVIDGATYTLSMWVRGSKKIKAYVKNEHMSTSKAITISTSWQYVSVTATMNKSLAAGGNICYVSETCAVGDWIEAHSFKLEKGNKATDWSVAPEDIDYSITSVTTTATQAADHFNWLVKSGTSATDFTLTDRMASLVSNNIDLTGYVTFNSLSTAGSTTINGANITTGTISADKISVTDLKALQAKIGGFTIADNSIYNTMSSLSSTSSGVYIGNDGIALGGGNFKVTSAGALTAKSGKIGGFDIGDTYLSKSSGITTGTAGTQYQVLLSNPDSPTSSSIAFGVRHRSYNGGSQSTESSFGSWVNDFYVSHVGSLLATKGKIGGWSILSDRISIEAKNSSNQTMRTQILDGTNQWGLTFVNQLIAADGTWISNPIEMHNDGSVLFGKADITGKITATSGAIGGWTIDSYGIRKTGKFSETNTSGLTAPDNHDYQVQVAMPNNFSGVSVVFGIKDATANSWPFAVRPNGEVNMSKANVTGSVNATTFKASCRDSTGKLLLESRLNGGFMWIDYTVESGGQDWDTYGKDYGMLNITYKNKSRYMSMDHGSILFNDENDSGGIGMRYDYSSHNISFNTGLVVSNNNYYYGYNTSGARRNVAGIDSNDHAHIGNTSSALYLYSGTEYIHGNKAYKNDSDERIKRDFEKLDKYEEFYGLLKPVSYKYKDEGEKASRKLGFKAQEVEKALSDSGLTNDEFGALNIESQPECEAEYWENTIGYNPIVDERKYSLAYSEFIALNTHMIQKLMKRINELEECVSLHKN